jgi:hypothetical protein
VFNYAWSLGMGIAPIVALVLVRDDPASTSFVLTAIGLGVVIVGIYVVSNVWKEPHYKVILAWDPKALPANWEGTAALLHDQLDPNGDDLDGVRPIAGGARLPLAASEGVGPRAFRRRVGSRALPLRAHCLTCRSSLLWRRRYGSDAVPRVTRNGV